MKLELDKAQAQGVTTDRLAGLITLQKRLLAATTVREAEYILVNDTGYLFPARQILLFRHGKLCAHSGSTDIDQPSPYLQWARRVAKTFGLLDDRQPTTLRSLTPADLASRSEELAEEWQHHWPHEGLWVPMNWHKMNHGGLLLLREKPWTESEHRLLGHWIDSTLPVLSRLARRPARPIRKTLIWGCALVVAGLSLLIPVRLSVLAQAEVIPAATNIIRAPLNGIIDQRVIEPNATVKAGQVLITLDDAELTGRLEKARQSEAVAQAEYQRIRQSAFRDPTASAEMPVLSARVDQAQEQVRFLEGELNRVTITATRDGIAIIGNPDDWVGRPVRLGERLMEVADTRGAHVELWLPSADAIPLESGAAVSLFLNVDPSQARHAELTHVNYRAETAPTGELAYRARAQLLADEALPRVGWRGTAKVDGEPVTLGYYLFRRPWTALRSWLGW